MGKLGLFKKLKSGKIFEEGLENYFKKTKDGEMRENHVAKRWPCKTYKIGDMVECSYHPPTTWIKRTNQQWAQWRPFNKFIMRKSWATQHESHLSKLHISQEAVMDHISMWPFHTLNSH